jgi:hypothetical protein
MIKLLPKPVENLITNTLQDVKPTVEKVQASVDKLNTTAENLSKDFDTAVNTHIPKAQKSFDDFIKVAEEMKDALRSMVSTGPLYISRMIEKLVSFIALSIALYYETSNAMRALIVFVFVTASGITTSLARHLAKLFEAYTPTNKDELVGHADDEVHENAFIAIVEVVKNMFGVTTATQKKIDSHRISIIKAYASLLKTGKDFVMFFIKMVNLAIAYVYEWWFGVPYEMEEREKIVLKDCSKWIDNALATMMQNVVEVRHDVNWRRSFENLYQEGFAIASRVKEIKMENTRLSLFMMLFKHIGEIHGEVATFMKSDKGRTRPVVIQLVGKPNVGKSCAIDMLIADIMYICENGRQYTAADKKTYAMGDEVKHLADGYDYQYAVVLDDIFQSAVTEDRKEAALMLIRVANDQTFEMKAAELDRKGKVFFDSPLVILTDNNEKTPGDLRLASNDAYKRRRDFLLLVERNPEFKGNGFDRAFYRFKFMDPMTETPEKEYVTYEKVLERVSPLMKKRRDSSKMLINVLKDEKKPDFLTRLRNEHFPLVGQMLKRGKMEEIPFTEDEPKKPTIEDRELEETILSGVFEHSTPEDREQDSDLVAAATTKDTTSVKKESVRDELHTKLDAIREDLKKSEKFIKRMTTRIKLACSGVEQPISNIGKAIIAGLSAITIFGSAAVIYKLIRKRNDVIAQGTYASYDPTVVMPRPVPVQKKKIVVERLNEVISGQQLDKQSMDIARTVVFPNIWELQIGTNAVHCTFPKDRSFVTVKHIFLACHGDIILRRGAEMYKITEEDIDIVTASGQDLACVHIKDKKFPTQRDITSHWMTQDDLASVYCNPATLVARKGTQLETRQSSKRTEYVGEKTYPISTTNSQRVTNDDTVFIAVPNNSGECGLPYLNNDTKIPRKIFGIHVAGGSYAAGTIVTREHLEAFGIVTDLVPHSAEFAIDTVPLGDLSASKIDVEALTCPNVTFIGTVPPQYTVRQPRHNSMVPSPLWGRWSEPSKRPSMLTPNREHNVSPFNVALQKKLVRDVVEYEDPLMKQVCDFIVDNIPTIVPPRVLTPDEAVNGPQGYQHLGPMERKTSMGWPYNTEHHNQKGKYDYLQYDPKTQRYSLIDRVEKARQALWNKHAAGNRRPTIVVTDNLKDELLPKRKVVDNDGKPVGNTRIMNTLPGEALTIERQLFGAFFENILRWQNRFDAVCDLGVDPHGSYGYMKIRCRLMSKWLAKHLLAGDLEKMDASISPVLTKWFGYIITEWYRRGGLVTEEELKVMEGMHAELSHVMHLALNLIYQAHGNPSGRFLTTIINSIVLIIVFILARIHYDMEHDPDFSIEKSMRLIWDTICTFGDDHVLPGDESDGFNMFHVAAEFKKYGMVYTGIYKDQPLQAYYGWEETMYLKRLFREVDGTWRGCLQKAHIEEIPYYIKRDIDPEIALTAVVDSALREAFLWGQPYFEECKTKWNDAMKELGYRPVNLTYQDLLRTYYRDHVLRDPETLEPIDLVGQMSEKVDLATFRAEVQKPEETTVQTTTFADNVGKENPKVETPVNITPLVNGTDPYPDQGLKQVLSRPYPVANFNWSTADAMGTEVGRLSFPQDLIAIPNVADKLKLFQYLRGGVRVSIRCNTTNMHAGKLQVNWIPHFSQSDPVNNPFQNIYTASTLNTHLFSAQSNNTLDFIIPFVGPSNYWNMRYDPNDPAEAEGFFGTVVIYILHPLTVLGATTTMTTNVTVYANFENPEVAGLGLRSTFSEKKKTKLVGQMKTNKRATKEARQKSKDQTEAAEDTAQGPTLFNTIVKGIGDFAMNGLSELLTTGLGLLDRPTSTETTKKMVIHNNTGLCHARGLDEGEILSMDPENKVSTDTKMFITTKDYNLFDNYKLRPGLVALGYFDNSNPIGYKPFVLPCTPTFCASSNSGTNYYYYLTPVGNLASHFGFWRGGLKYMIKFTASRYASARVRITWLPDPTFSASLASNQEGDTVNRVVDITGDTETSFTIPWLREQYWTEVITPKNAIDVPIETWDGFNGQVVCTILNPVVNASDSVSSRIYFAVYLSGAEDFDVATPVGLWDTFQDGTILPTLPANKLIIDRPQEEEKLVGQMSTGNVSTDIVKIFEMPFEPLIPAKVCIPDNIHMGERVQSWTELIKRPSLANAQTDFSIGVEQNPWDLTAMDYTRFQRVCRTFQFRRGSIRVKAKCIMKIAVYIYAANLAQLDDHTLVNIPAFIERGLTTMSFSQKRFIEFQIPYYSPYNMVCESFTHEKTYLPSFFLWATDSDDALMSTKFTIYFAAGDDFILGWPINPPVVMWTSASPGGKQPDSKNSNSNKNVIFNNQKQKTK